MKRSIRLRREAQKEYEEAVEWYEKRRKGLGLQYLFALQKILHRIAEASDSFPVVFENVREAVMRKWPYAIYFQVTDEYLLVLAIFHASREPVQWQNRVTQQD